MYAATHSFLREHNGIRPNTLHVLFDIVTIAILIDLAVLTAQPPDRTPAAAHMAGRTNKILSGWSASRKLPASRRTCI
jgi:hypothetical protein